MIEPDPPSNRLEECVASVLAKRESVALERVHCHVDDRVGQAPRGTDDRDRAVAEADHLSQTTRLELRGHQEEIGTRSEEHTSELQSHSDLVCRLLLEKK